MYSEHHGLILRDFSGLLGGGPYTVVDGTELCRLSGLMSCRGDCKYGFDGPCEGVKDVVRGAEETARGCHMAASGQDVEWRFELERCTTPQATESIAIAVAALDDVEARLVLPRMREYELMAAHFGATARRVGAPPLDAAAYAGARVVAGAQMWLMAELVERGGSRQVGFNTTKLEVTMEPRAGAAPAVERDHEHVKFTPAAGSRFAPVLTLADRRWELAELAAVSTDAAASLELSGLVVEDTFAVEAIVRDAEGRVMLGAPISWRDSGGEFVVGAGAPYLLAGPDIGTNIDDCAPQSDRGRTRRVIVEASLGELSARLAFDVEGKAVDPERYDADWVAPEGCAEVIDEGCGCRSNDGAVGLLLGAPWLLWRRRGVSRRG